MVAFGAVLGMAPPPKKPPSAPKKEKPPIVEKITDNVYRIGKVILDSQARTITCTGEINMVRGGVEYLAVAPGGKTHESLLLLNVRPLHLQVALLLLDLKPKNVLERQGDPRKPEGDPVTIWVRWRKANGEMQEVRAEDLVLKMPAETTMPHIGWVFTGSRILKEGFEADFAKSLIAIWHDPAAILDIPSAEEAENSFFVHTERVPKRRTRIELVIKAPPKPQETIPPK
jgi:hypothetical protein